MRGHALLKLVKSEERQISGRCSRVRLFSNRLQKKIRRWKAGESLCCFSMKRAVRTC